MTTTPPARRRVSRFYRLLKAALLTTGLATLCGCAYLEAQSKRIPEPDDRVLLGRSDFLFVRPRDLDNYVCASPLQLQCERGGAVSYYTCQCSLR